MSFDKQPTQINSRQEGEDRTAYLRDMLQYPMSKDDLVPVVREMARLMVSINSDLSTLPDLRNGLARMEKFFLKFMEDQLTFRQQRELMELEAARKKVAQAEEDVDRTSQKIKSIKLTGATGVPLPPPARFSAEWWRLWFAEKVLPYMVYSIIAGVSLLVATALWAYFKTNLGLP